MISIVFACILAASFQEVVAMNSLSGSISAPVSISSSKDWAVWENNVVKLRISDLRRERREFRENKIKLVQDLRNYKAELNQLKRARMNVAVQISSLALGSYSESPLAGLDKQIAKYERDITAQREALYENDLSEVEVEEELAAFKSVGGWASKKRKTT